MHIDPNARKTFTQTVENMSEQLMAYLLRIKQENLAKEIIMNRVPRLMLAAVFSLSFLIISVPKSLVAQIAPQQPTKESAKVDDQKLRSFAKVYVQVEKIRQMYEPRAKEAKGPEEGKQVQKEAESKMQEALTNEGLTEENYTQIFEVARADQDVRKKLLQMIVEERGKS
jgi:uncharacterized protein DUF4168